MLILVYFLYNYLVGHEMFLSDLSTFVKQFDTGAI